MGNMSWYILDLLIMGNTHNQHIIWDALSGKETLNFHQ